MQKGLRAEHASALGAYRLWAILGWLLVLAVVVLSLVSIEQPLKLENADKYQHVLAYGALMYWWGMVQPTRRARWATALPLMGLVLEGAQSLTPDRMMEWRDALANLAGVMLGLLLLKSPAQRLLTRLDRHLGNRLDARGT